MASVCLQGVWMQPSLVRERPSFRFLLETSGARAASIPKAHHNRIAYTFSSPHSLKRCRKEEPQHRRTVGLAKSAACSHPLFVAKCSQNAPRASSSSLIGYREDDAGLCTSGTAASGVKPGEAGQELQLDGGSGNGDWRGGGGGGGAPDDGQNSGGGGEEDAPGQHGWQPWPWAHLAAGPLVASGMWKDTGQQALPSGLADEDGARREPREGKKGAGFAPPVWTTTLIGLNVLCFAANVFSKNLLLLLGAKVNVLIDRGQWWRLLTPALLHRDVLHLAVNTYSLRSLGTAVEGVSGPGRKGGARFLAIYWASALAGNLLSYRFTPLPCVGSSTALFGLIGAVGLYRWRHRKLVGESWSTALKSVAVNVGLNLALGWWAKGVDNWGHLGGLLGGLGTAWLLGPELRMVSPPNMAPALVDLPPIRWLELYLKQKDKNAVEVINQWLLH